MIDKDKFLKAAAKHPKPDGQVYAYGTAGFRMKAHLLDSVVFRAGLLAALRSRRQNLGIGIVITASHNPPEDNGIKLVDPMGEMLDLTWEGQATLLANADNDALYDVYVKMGHDLKVNPNQTAHVVFARDTRASGSTLVASLVDALKAVDCIYEDHKLLTTPQLHYIVRCINTAGTEYAYGVPTEVGYYEKVSSAFKKALTYNKPTGKIIVDCANGIGGPKLRELIKYLDGTIDIKIVNDDIVNPESLNVQCGADFVKTNQRAPPSLKAGYLDRCASLDGDADRLIYYFTDKGGKFRLLDGDRLATLAAMFITDLITTCGLREKLTMGVVQTAYANGASTQFIKEYLKLDCVCVATGVKHLHQAAQRYGVGIYFEANGHGTVLFSERSMRQIYKVEPRSPAHKDALTILRSLAELSNQAVGDAIADMLMMEVILTHRKWDCDNWLKTYTDLPNRLVRVEVRDRSEFVATDAERKLVSPKGIQGDIDALVAKYKQGRAFARASGTEDAVRVYAEAATRGEADELASKVAGVVSAYGE